MPGAFEEDWQIDGEIIADNDDEQMGFYYLGEQIPLRSALEWTDEKELLSHAYLDLDETTFASGSAMSTVPANVQTKTNEIIMKEVADWLDTGSSFRRPDLEKHHLLQALAAMTSVPIGLVSRSVGQNKFDYDASLRDVIVLFTTLQLLACSFTLPPPPALPGTLYMTPSQRQTPALISSLRYHSLIAPQSPASGHQARAQTAIPTWPGPATRSSREEQLADEVTRRRVERVRRQSMSRKAPSQGDLSQEEILDHIIRQQKLERWMMDGPQPRPDVLESGIVEAESSHASKRKRTEATSSSTQPPSVRAFRAIRSTRPSAWTATPVIRSEPHHVYVQPVRELSLRRRLREACRVSRRLRSTLPASSRMPFETPESDPPPYSSDLSEGQSSTSNTDDARPPQTDGPADVGSPDPPPARTTHRSVSEMMLEASTIESQASNLGPNAAPNPAERPGAFPGPSTLLEMGPACKNPVGFAAAPALDRYYSHAKTSAIVPPPPRNEPILPPPARTLPQPYTTAHASTIQRQTKTRRPNFWKRFSSRTRGIQSQQQATSVPVPAAAPTEPRPASTTIQPASSSTWLVYRSGDTNGQIPVESTEKRLSVEDLDRARASHATYRRIFAEMELLLVRAEGGRSRLQIRVRETTG